MTAEVAKKYILTNHFDGMVDVKAIVGGNEETMAMKLAVEALEKQIPKKVISGYDEQDSICCPNCKGELLSMDWYDHWKCNYCEFCGQALDWSEEKR